MIADVVKGTVALASGHLHRLNAMVLANARTQGALQTASLSVGKVVSGIGRAALSAVPGIAAMGTGLLTALAPVLPAILPIIAAAAALGAVGYVIYRNWEPIKAFFVDNFETIRNTLLLVFPPLGLLVGFAGIIRQNWDGVKEFFATLWETVKLTTMIVFESIKFVALNALLAIKKTWSGITQFFGSIWSGIHEFFINTPLAPIFEWMVGWRQEGGYSAHRILQ